MFMYALIVWILGIMAWCIYAIIAGKDVYTNEEDNFRVFFVPWTFLLAIVLAGDLVVQILF